MKRLILLIMLCLPSVAMAQTDHIAPLVDKYSTKKNCSTVVLSGDMLKSMGANAGVEYMQMIAVEDVKLIGELKSDIEAIAKGYSLLMAVNSSGELVKIYHVTQVFKGENGNKRKELQEYLIVSISESEGVVVRLVGNDIKLNEATSILENL